MSVTVHGGFQFVKILHLKSRVSDLNILSAPGVIQVLSKFEFGYSEQLAESAILGSFSLNTECRVRCNFCML